MQRSVRAHPRVVHTAAEEADRANWTTADYSLLGV